MQADCWLAGLFTVVYGWLAGWVVYFDSCIYYCWLAGWLLLPGLPAACLAAGWLADKLLLASKLAEGSGCWKRHQPASNKPRTPAYFKM